jgi:acetolactate decarboxylase
MKIETLLVSLLALILGGCSSPPKNHITQISTIDALLASVYDGQMNCHDLLKYGTFGIGTFDRLDGEMIILDGVIFKVKSTGEVVRPASDETTPFATLLFFEPDLIQSVDSPLTFQSLEQWIDRVAPDKNLFCAIKLTGTFSYLKTRSVPPQKRPYPPLSEVARQQPEFEYRNLAGTLVGFRCPAFVKGINVPDYHLHFISDDQTCGGHVLELQLESGRLELDRCNRFTLILPEGSDAFNQADLSKDRTTELQRVER